MTPKNLLYQAFDMNESSTWIRCIATARAQAPDTKDIPALHKCSLLDQLYISELQTLARVITITGIQLFDMYHRQRQASAKLPLHPIVLDWELHLIMSTHKRQQALSLCDSCGSLKHASCNRKPSPLSASSTSSKKANQPHRDNPKAHNGSKSISDYLTGEHCRNFHYGLPECKVLHNDGPNKGKCKLSHVCPICKGSHSLISCPRKPSALGTSRRKIPRK